MNDIKQCSYIDVMRTVSLIDRLMYTPLCPIDSVAFGLASLCLWLLVVFRLIYERVCMHGYLHKFKYWVLWFIGDVANLVLLL